MSSKPPCPPSPGARIHRAFSLVEMLVVVSIIAILLGILGPGLATMRKEGARVYCLNNMKEINKTMLIYSNDYHELTPQSHIGGEDHQSYSDLLLPYLFDNPSRDPMDPTKMDLVNYTNTRIFGCPSTHYVPKGTASGGGPSIHASAIDSNNGAKIDYGLNNHGRPYNDNRGGDHAPKSSGDPGFKFWKDNFLGTVINRSRDEIKNHDVVFLAETEGDWDPERWGAVSRSQNKIEWPLVASLGDDHEVDGGGNPKYPENHRPDAYLRHRDGFNVTQLDGAGTWHSGIVEDLNNDGLITAIEDIYPYLRKFHVAKTYKKTTAQWHDYVEEEEP